ncbi:hypothetical protein B0H16DRAFT_1465706 [Mycena metata]|uniref:Uncharacterized protein n=1 Tax=Mycena metata TaxID=1033252 RepID=A0AAD7IAF2_9AGAR|nr:hypothetical protein B0H16DRAFT_1465706 [Mycena metata]
MCNMTPKFAFKTRGDPLTFPGCKSLSVGLNRFSHSQITPESITLPSTLALNRESCSELHHLFSQPFKTPRVRILLFYDNLDARCVNAGLYIIHEFPPLTLNSERLSELHHLFAQPLKTHASSVLGLYHTLLHHLFVQPLRTHASSALGLYHTFASSADAEQLGTLRAPPPLCPAAQDPRQQCIRTISYFCESDFFKTITLTPYASISTTSLSSRSGPTPALRHLFVQPLKTYASSVLGRIRILAFFDNVDALCIKAGLDSIHEPPPLTLNSERLSEPFKTPAGNLDIINELPPLTLNSERLCELPHLLAQPLKAHASSALGLSHTFANTNFIVLSQTSRPTRQSGLGGHSWASSAHAEQRETLRAPTPLISAAQDPCGCSITPLAYFW